MLKKDEYLKIVRRPYPPLFVSIICHGYKNPDNFAKILDKKFAVKHQVKVDAVWYYSKAETNVASKLSFNDWKRPEKLKWLKQEFAKREQTFLASTKKNFEEYVEAYEHYMPTLALVWNTEFTLLPRLRKLLGKKLAHEETEKLLDTLNIPLRDNLYKQEQWDLVHTKNLKSHALKYAYLNSRYGEYKPYTAKQASSALKNISVSLFLKNWRDTKQQVKNAVIRAKKLLPLTDKPMVDLMQFIIHYRTHRTDIMNMSHFLAYPILKKQAKKIDLTYKEFLYCTREEALGIVRVSKKNLYARMRGHAVGNDTGKPFCVSGKEYIKLKKFFTEDTKNVTELKGNVASNGFAKGKVKLIFSTKDFPKIRPGDILVTSMTNPHMVPIMKKAAAFVTDEGGITSHAAIIAREMKKPCIIGTKLATQVFKDGDLVEVDANIGMVKKIG